MIHFCDVTRYGIVTSSKLTYYYLEYFVPKKKIIFFLYRYKFEVERLSDFKQIDFLFS